MEGLMQNHGLVVTDFIDHAANFHPDSGVTSVPVEGGRVSLSWLEIRDRAKAVALALKGFGVRPGDRVATLAFNTHRHLETWFGIMGIGAVCHTLNPRLFPDDLEYIAGDAGDVLLLTDSTLAPLARRLAGKVPSIRGVVYLCGREHVPSAEGRTAEELCYEEIVAAHLEAGRAWEWEPGPETGACGLCYTSGTTGRPKGVVYSHRSNFLHALSISLPDTMCLSARSTCASIVPLFHANSWGLAFAAPATGAHLVLPGPNLDGPSLSKLLRETKTTVTAGVPTVWLGLLQHLQETGERLPDLKLVAVAGAAAPEVLFQGFEALGAEVRHAWGMTELSPIGTAAAPKISSAKLTDSARHAQRLRQGVPHALIQLRVVGADGKRLPHDGKSTGVLQTRGPIVISRYYKRDELATDADGWFDTGDVGNISPEGYMLITDRSKDVIKSGGEWISSIEIENNAVGHPDVAEAAVIGVAHPKWTERPLLVVVRKNGSAVTAAQILQYLKTRIATWWIPDTVEFVDEIPHTATGKINKLALRARFGSTLAKAKL